jgi:CRP-like cAMP-binding protein
MVKRSSTAAASITRPLSNQLLAALPPADYARLAATLHTIPLKLKDPIHKPDETIEFVYFPGGGFCSVLTVLKDGSMVEVATIGREGMVGLSAMLNGQSPSPSLSMVQGETDTCYRMPVEVFRHEMDQHGAFYELVTRYAQALVGVIMQSTACNAVHTVEQRLARWLLMAHDRMGTDAFPLTQEFVAMMLGVARPTVTVVAGSLQKTRLITYQRGTVTILNRKKLEAESCECYRTCTDLLDGVTSGPKQAANNRPDQRLVR